MIPPRLLVYLGILCYLPVVSSITATETDSVSLPCNVLGTYTLPGWTKGADTIIIEGSDAVNPSYQPRFKLDNDQTSLAIAGVELSDAGTYECTHASGTNSPQTTSLTVVIATTTTQPGNNSCNETCCEVTKAVCGFFVPDIVVFTVVIIKCSHILIGEHKRQKEEEEKEETNGKSKDNDGQNACIGTEEDRIREHKLVRVIIITAAVIFIAVSAWFIAMQATDEDCEEICECDVHIGLLAFEVVDFVLGVGFVIYLFYNYRASPDVPTCDQCGGVKTPSSSGGDKSTAAVQPTMDNNPDPRKQMSVMKPIVKPKSGDTGHCHPDVSPQHRPQPALPPKESVSRRDVKLDPIPPIRKNNSTTEFHMDNPESEGCNIKVSIRGLSAVFDQEFDQPRTKRLPPLDHTVRDESIRRKKKKKKTKTNNDNVKFDNDYD